MYAQLTYFDGPRTPEQVAASDFAGRNGSSPRSAISATATASTSCAATTDRRSS